MTEILWRLLARQLARPSVATWLIDRSKRTTYMHLTSADGQDIYMERYWLFNPYDRETNIPHWAPLIPFSIRVHCIRREDRDRDLHDHPWNARTIILRGFYTEKRLVDGDAREEALIDLRQSGLPEEVVQAARVTESITRQAGDTAALRFGEYHRISEVSEDGVYTLFISGKWRGVWGFLVDGVKVPWKKYLGLER